MLIKLRLLKACKLDEQPVAKGEVIELDDTEDKTEIDQLIADSIAEKFVEGSVPDPRDAELDALRAESILLKAENAKLTKKPVKRMVHYVHDNSEGDPASRFKSFGEQLLAVFNVANNQGVDKRLKAATGLNETVGSEGGFLVQTDFVTDLLTRTYEAAVLASRVRRIPLTSGSNALSINGVDETSRADGSRWGGIRMYWADEAETKTASMPKFRRINLKLNKLVGLCYVTDELLQDVGALESFIQQAFADEMAFKVDDAILRGTGSGQPLGILNSTAKITVNKETGQLANSIVFQNPLSMRARLWARSRPNSVWLINQDAEGALQSMAFIIRNAAGTENVGGGPVYLPAGGVSGQPFDTLYGRPILPIEQAESLGTEGDLMLVDLSQYLLIDKGGLQSASSIHVRFVNDETCFRFVYRVDGQPLWSSSIAPYRGTTAIGPFVTLQTRS